MVIGMRLIMRARCTNSEADTEIQYACVTLDPDYIRNLLARIEKAVDDRQIDDLFRNTEYYDGAADFIAAPQNDEASGDDYFEEMYGKDVVKGLDNVGWFIEPAQAVYPEYEPASIEIDRLVVSTRDVHWACADKYSYLQFKTDTVNREQLKQWLAEMEK